MIDCLVLGDSIAVGVSQARPECVAYAKVGINSRDWFNQNFKYSPYIADTVIISLGSNDYKNIKTESELRTIRQLTISNRVYWILPAIKPDIRIAVNKIAKEFGDIVLERPIKDMSPDGIHPTGKGYKKLAEETK